MITCKLFKTAFMERFFPREMQYSKVYEFINLNHGSMIVIEYSLKFIKFSKYATPLVSNSRNDIRRNHKVISEDLEEVCGVAMLHDNKDLHRLMVHVQKV